MLKSLPLNNLCNTEPEIKEYDNEAEIEEKSISTDRNSASADLSEVPSNLSRAMSLKEVNAIIVVEERQEEEDKLEEPIFCIFQTNVLYILSFCGHFFTY